MQAEEAERVSLRERVPEIGESAPWVVRTALCVEPRDGRLHLGIAGSTTRRAPPFGELVGLGRAVLIPAKRG